MNVLSIQVPWWKKAWDDEPLKVILFIALFFRLLAAFFSKGYAFHDEHFDVVRVAQDWIDGIPHWIANDIPPNHSIFYAGINALFMFISEALGLTDPQGKMYVLRVLHGLYSLLIVYYGYKITYKLSNEKDAKIVGLMLALLWFMPYLSVQYLVEMVCLPPLLAAFYIIVDNNVKNKHWLYAGMLIGLAFTFRLHVVIFAGGVGMVMLYKKQFVQALYFSLGFILASICITGLIDVIFWDYPYQSIYAYFAFNTSHAYDFATGPFYRFILTVLGFFVPPISLLLLFGYIKSWKISNEMWLAATLFFIIHSIYPNKQERFIIPFFPYFIILGVISWNQFLRSSNWWKKQVKLLRGFWVFFWVMNILVAGMLALSYSKKDRIEPLTYLSKKDDLKGVIITSSSGIKPIPEYYLGGIPVLHDKERITLLRSEERIVLVESVVDKSNLKVIYQKPKSKSMELLQEEITSNGTVPNYVIFKEPDNLEQAKRELLTIFEGKRLEQIKEISPSLLDKVLHFLNPGVHKERTGYIYKLVDM